MPKEQLLTISPAERKRLRSFIHINDELTVLRKSLSREEMHHELIDKQFQQIMSSYQIIFDQAFNQVQGSSEFFKQGKVENFTSHFLANLLIVFQKKVANAIAAYAHDEREKSKLLQTFASLQKLMAFITDIYVGKVSSADFMDDFNHKLLTINDTSLITTLITDYSLGSKKSHVQEFVNKHDLDRVIENSITALDNVLKNSTADHLLSPHTAIPKV